MESNTVIDKSLLLVIGGTTQSDIETIFTRQELENSKFDVLQFNLITALQKYGLKKYLDAEDPNICFFNPEISINDKTQNAEEGYISSLDSFICSLRATNKVSRQKQFLCEEYWETNDDNLKESGALSNEELIDISKTLARYLNLKSTKENFFEAMSILKGMSVLQFRSFAKIIADFFEKFEDKLNKSYSNLVVLAHSRGCCIASLATMAIFNLLEKRSSTERTMSIKRLVLLDPVGCNLLDIRNDISRTFAKSLRYLTQKARKTEIHFILKALPSPNIPWANYPVHDILNFFSSSKHDTKSPKPMWPSVDNILNQNQERNIQFENVFVHTSDSAHEGMLQFEFRTAFPEYCKILSMKKWDTMYFYNSKKIGNGFGTFILEKEDIECLDETMCDKIGHFSEMICRHKFVKTLLTEKMYLIIPSEHDYASKAENTPRRFITLKNKEVLYLPLNCKGGHKNTAFQTNISISKPHHRVDHFIASEFEDREGSVHEKMQNFRGSKLPCGSPPQNDL